MALSAVLFAAVGLSGCASEAATRETPATSVEISKAALSSIQNEIAFAGQIKPFNSVAVAPKTAGKVKETFFQVGDNVTEGDTLFTLDEEDISNQIKSLSAQLEQAALGVERAQTGLSTVTGGQYESQVLQQRSGIDSYGKAVENARITLDNAGVAVRNAEVTVSDAELAMKNAQTAVDNYDANISNALTAIDSAQINADSAKDALDKTAVLYENGAVSRSSYDSAETAYKQSLNALDQTKNSFRTIQAGYEQTLVALESGRNNYEKAKNGLLAAENSRATAEIALNKSEADLNSAQAALGLVEGRIVEENRTTASQGVAAAAAGVSVINTQLEIARDALDNTSVTAPISGVISQKGIAAGEFASPQAPAFTIIESDVVKVIVKASELALGSVEVGDHIDVFIRGLRNEPFDGVVSSVSPAADITNTYPVTIEIDNPDGAIKPGMFAEVKIMIERSEGVVVIPINAVLKSADGDYVYLNDNKTAKKTIVTTGIDNGKEIEIVSGISESDEVIVKGQTYVSDGRPINVVEGD
jgi:RND family efflux transporter MFP subunit